MSVLLVDDNPIQLSTRQIILRKAGFSVNVASNAIAALQLVSSAPPGQIRLILTDHIMPGMNGAEFVRRLRQSDPKTQIIVISGLAEAEAEYADLDVIFRLKPIHPEELIALVHSLLEDGLTRSA